MKLRVYQDDAIGSVFSEFAKGIMSTLLILATGLGKTVVFCFIAKRIADKGGRVLILAHRDTLIYQAARKVKAITGEKPDIEMADQYAGTAEGFSWASRFVVSTIQSQISGRGDKKRMHRFDPFSFSMVIIDEAHRAAAGSYIEVVNHYRRNPNLLIVGVTATGDRTDGKGLGRMFESVAYEFELPDAIDQGWLVPIRQRPVIVDGLDFSQCRATKAGDIMEEDLAAVMEFESNLHPVAHATLERACLFEPGFLEPLKDDNLRHEKIVEALAGRKLRKTIVFTVSVKQAERICEIFNRWVPGCARFICGETPKEERPKLFSDYAAGEYSILCNVGCLVEGFDEPGVELLSMARPSKSRLLVTQMVGRVTRPLDEIAALLGELPDAESRRNLIAGSTKPSGEILDFVGNSGKHKLITSVDVLAGKDGDDAITELAKEIAKEGEIDVSEALEIAACELEENRQAQAIKNEEETARLLAEAEKERQAIAARRAGLVATTKYQIEDVGDGYVGPERHHAARRGGCTDKQVELLVKLGVRRETAQEYGKKQAGSVISSLKEKRCTDGQAKYLRVLGVEQSAISGMNFDQASKEIERRKSQETAR